MGSTPPSAPGVAVLVTLLLVLATPASAASQGAPGDRDHHFAALSANAVLGAGTAGVRALLEGRDVGDAVLRGALGGSVGWAGKWVAMGEWGAAPLTGRVLASAGDGMVRRAGEPGPLLESVVLPLGPMHLDVPLRGGRPRASVSLVGTATLIWALTRPELEMDWRRSLSVGAPVFAAPRHRIRVLDTESDGFHAGGVLLVRSSAPDDERVFRHEVIHLFQHDFATQTWFRPTERWLLDRTPAGAVVPDWLHLDLLGNGLSALDAQLFGFDDGLHGLPEAEARWFAGR